MKTEIIWEEDTLTPGMAEFTIVANEAIQLLVEDLARRMQDYAQANAIWEDRTGEARKGLTAEAETSETISSITLYHTQTYGIWLEVRWSGRYAIIIPTIEHFGPILMTELDGLMGVL